MKNINTHFNYAAKILSSYIIIIAWITVFGIIGSFSLSYIRWFNEINITIFNYLLKIIYGFLIVAPITVFSRSKKLKDSIIAVSIVLTTMDIFSLIRVIKIPFLLLRIHLTAPGIGFYLGWPGIIGEVLGVSVALSTAYRDSDGKNC